MVCLLKGSEVKNHHNIDGALEALEFSSFTQDTLEAPVSLYSEHVNTFFGVYNILDNLFNNNLKWTEIAF